jgi:transglutaminase-like putative cysteine protease
LRGIDAAYEKFRAEFLAELQGQSGDSSRLTALAEELRTLLAEYLDLLDKRGEYMVVQRLPERIEERHARNVQIANEKVANLLAMIDRALVAIAGIAKTGDAEEVGAFFTENRATQTEVKITRNHLLKKKGFAQEQFQEKSSPETESAGKSGVFALAAQGEPTAADTAPTADIRITQEMIDLAGSFGNSPTGIVNWVRSNIGYMPYYGSLKGSELTFLDKAGNDLDTCSLTMALLRAAGIPCRYVIGTVEFDYETYRNLVGVDTKDAVSAVLGTQEKPGGVLFLDQATGLPTAVQVGHVWVAAYLPVNYRGTGSGPTRAWIQFDPSVRSFVRTDRAPASAITDQDPTAIAEEIQAAAVYDATQSKIVSFNRNVAHSISADTAAGVDSFYAENGTGGNFFTENDLLYGKTTIVADNWDVFPISLPFKVKLTNSVVSEVPSGLQYKVSFTFSAPPVDDPTGFEPPVVVTRTYASAELAAKRITVFALPQSGDDTTAMYNVNATAPTIRFPDGSTGEVSRLALIQADAVHVLPVLFVNGQHQMLGPIQSYGAENEFLVGITGPEGTYNETAGYEIRAGGYHAVAIDLGNTETELSTRMTEGIVDRLDRLATTIAKQAGGSGQRLTEDELIRADDLVGAALYMAALNYFVELNYKEKQWANSLGVLRLRNPSVCVVSQEMVVDESADFLGRITR